MTRAAWNDVRRYVRDRRAFWWLKDEASRAAGESCVESLRALVELDTLDDALTRIRNRHQRRRRAA